MAQPILRFFVQESLLISLIKDYWNSKQPTPEGAPELKLMFVGRALCDRLRGSQDSEFELTASSITARHLRLALKHFFESNKSSYIAQARRTGTKAEFEIIRDHDYMGTVMGYERVRARIFGVTVYFSDPSRSTFLHTAEADRIGTGARLRETTMEGMAYDIITGELWDVTGRAMEHITTGCIATPMRAPGTFRAHPLRALKLIRMSCEPGHFLHPDVKAAINEDFLKTLADDLRNRKLYQGELGEELLKGILGGNPLQYMKMIHEFKLHEHILVNQFMSEEMSRVDGLRLSLDATFSNSNVQAYTIVGQLLGLEPRDMILSRHEVQLIPRDLWLLAAFSHLVALKPHEDWPNGGDNIMESIRFSLSMICPSTSLLEGTISAAFMNMDQIMLCVHKVKRGTLPSTSTLGAPMHKWGTTWRTQVLFAMLATVALQGDDQDEIKEIMKDYDRLLSFIDRYRLEAAVYLKPAITNEQFKTCYGVDDREAQELVDLVIAWELDHPGGSMFELTEWLSDVTPCYYQLIPDVVLEEEEDNYENDQWLM